MRLLQFSRSDPLHSMPAVHSCRNPSCCFVGMQQPSALFCPIRCSDPLQSMTAVWLLPVIPVIVCAGSGGQLAREASLGAADSIIDMRLGSFCLLKRLV